jgi:hypothetical protein
MRLAELKTRIPALLIFVTFACAQSTFAQASRIPPRFVDEWYDRRYLVIIVLGALLALLTSWLWLPALLPKAHQDDNRRARLHAFMALVLSLVILAVALLLDINAVADFGRQSYQFKELFSDVFLSRQTFIMLGMAAAVFVIIITFWTRFLSEKFYRYMIIPR